MPDECHELSSLFQLAMRALPRLAGRIGPAGPHELDCGAPGNAERLARLHHWWQQAHLDAGPHYWSTRSWTLLIWQPIYFSVLAVHLGQRSPCLAHLSQELCEGFVGGFCLPAHRPRRGEQGALIRHGAGQLRRFVERQLLEFNGISSIHPKLARLLAVDCTRAALLMVQREKGLANDDLRGLERQWMDHLAQPLASSLIEVHLDDGKVCLALERKACCQHFRRSDGEWCSTCPKLKQDERNRRLKAELTPAP